MIIRFTGILESVGTNTAILALDGGGAGGGGTGSTVAHELLIPAYLAERLKSGRMPDGTHGSGGGIGGKVTFHTLQYFEAVGQGTSFIPRTLGFGTPHEREFFELITSVKGLGNKRATRALAEEPASIAAWIAARDVKGLQRLPEIGKKLAETIILELRDKIQPMLLALGSTPSDIVAAPQSNGYFEPKPVLSREAEEAVIALTSLGQSRQQAERMVELALQRTPTLATPDEIVSAACAIRI